MTRTVSIGLCMLLALPARLPAQEEEPAWQQLMQALKQRYLSVGLLLQTVLRLELEAETPRHREFTMAAARRHAFYGGDARLVHGNALLAVEIVSRRATAEGLEPRTDWGHYTTAG